MSTDSPFKHLVVKPSGPILGERKYNNYQETGIFYLSGAIDESTIKPVIEWILSENARKEHKKLTLIITSPGGYLYDCFALLDIMEGSKIPIDTVGLGCIASCGFVIFLYGKNRILTPNTFVLSHQYSGGAFGKHHELVAERKSQDWMHGRLVKIYAKKTGLSAKKVEEILLPKSDVILTSEEALKLGVCDEVRLNEF